MKNILLETCIDSTASAIAAEQGGAQRVELCANLFEGGTTPPVGIVIQTKARISIGLHVMIRPRGGDFLYSPDEFAAMRHDVEAMKAAGADGIVLGVLNPDGTVDIDRNRELIELARPMRVTFHRAFDVTPDPVKALEDIISLGCERVLTSGQEASVVEGLPLVRQLVDQAAGRIIIMPGAGITARNMDRVAAESGAEEFHVLINRLVESGMTYRQDHMYMGGKISLPEFEMQVIDSTAIRSLLK